MDPTPCHNCITLGICKAQISQHDINILTASRGTIYLAIADLGRKCSLMHDYINAGHHYNYNIYQRRLAVHYLTGVDLGGDADYTTRSMEDIYRITKMEMKQ